MQRVVSRLVIGVSFLATGALAEGVGGVGPGAIEMLEPRGFIERVQGLSGQDRLSAGCCKTCRKGKACGDSCIAKTKSCRAGKGCACNG